VSTGGAIKLANGSSSAADGVGAGAGAELASNPSWGKELNDAGVPAALALVRTNAPIPGAGAETLLGGWTAPEEKPTADCVLPSPRPSPPSNPPHSSSVGSAAEGAPAPVGASCSGSSMSGGGNGKLVGFTSPAKGSAALLLRCWAAGGA